MHMVRGLETLIAILSILDLWHFGPKYFGPVRRLKFCMHIPIGPKIICIKYQFSISMYMVRGLK